MLNVLIAMMTVIVIGIVLASLWRGFGPSRHIADALKDANALKDVVLEAATVRGGLAQVHATDLHYNRRASVGTYIASAEIADGGLITLHTRNTGANPDPTLMLIPKERNGEQGSEITWTCKLVLTGYSLSPPDCLNQNATMVQSVPEPAPQAERVGAAATQARTAASTGGMRP